MVKMTRSERFRAVAPIAGATRTCAPSARAPENLTARQQAKLPEIQHTDEDLCRAYLLKEQLRQIDRLPAQPRSRCSTSVSPWARRCPLTPFVRLARTITDQRRRDRGRDRARARRSARRRGTGSGRTVPSGKPGARAVRLIRPGGRVRLPGGGSGKIFLASTSTLTPPEPTERSPVTALSARLVVNIRPPSRARWVSGRGRWCRRWRGCRAARAAGVAAG